MSRARFMGPEHRKKLSESKKAMWQTPGFKERYFSQSKPRKYRVKSGGYWWVYEPTHLNANRQGRVIEQRFLMEKHIGRPLKDGEIVHHIDHNPLNNNMENLQLTNHSEHARIHHRRPQPIRKLTDSDAMRVRVQYAQGGYTYQSLADQYNVGIDVICRICTYKTYKHLPKVIHNKHRINVSKLTENEVREIKNLYNQKVYDQPILARRYGVSQSCIQLIVTGKRWKHIN